MKRNPSELIPDAVGLLDAALSDAFEKGRTTSIGASMDPEREALELAQESRDALGQYLSAGSHEALSVFINALGEHSFWRGAVEQHGGRPARGTGLSLVSNPVRTKRLKNQLLR